MAIQTLVLMILGASAAAAERRPVIVVPPCDTTLHMTLPVPSGFLKAKGQAWSLVEPDTSGKPIPAERVTIESGDGSRRTRREYLVASVASQGEAKKTRRLELVPVKRDASSPAFRFHEIDDKSLGLWEGRRPVYVYNHGVISKPGVPEDRKRSTYLHPIYNLEGKSITDDFPADHYHHRGLFWAWPHVGIGGHEYNLWLLEGVRQEFERWTVQHAGTAAAGLGIENGWYVGAKKVMHEDVLLMVYASTATERMMDVELTWTPVDEPVTLWGASGKSYGGLTFRFGPRTETVITTPAGQQPEDLRTTRLPWADLSARFTGTSEPSGAAVLIAPSHPDFPPTWLTRHYGVLCVGWPGVTSFTLKPGEPIRCRYRIWIHQGQVDVPTGKRVHAAFQLHDRVTWQPSPN